MRNTKWFLFSRRTLGAIIMLLGLFVDLPPGLREALPGMADQLMEAIAILVGLAVSAWGYFKRDKTKKLTVLPKGARLPWIK